jgi:hypothetical protein
MSVQTFIILTPAQKASAEALNDGNAAVMPRLVDNPLAGDILNKYVAPARILNDPAYARWFVSLTGLPRQILDSDMIFAPVLDL